MNTYKIIFDKDEFRDNIEIFVGTHDMLVKHVLKMVDKGFTNIQAISIGEVINEK